MIFLQVFLGILAAFLVLRLVFFARMARYARHGFGRHGRGGHRLFRLYRELSLTRAQKDEIRTIFRELKQSAREVRGDLPQDLARLVGGSSFDRVGAQRLADDRLGRLAQVKDRFLAALERVHALLTPEQRARLAAFSA